MIELIKLDQADREQFIKDNQEAFNYGAMEEFAGWGIFSRPMIAIVAIIMWGTGDAASDLVGIPYGKHKVHCKLTDG